MGVEENKETKETKETKENQDNQEIIDLSEIEVWNDNERHVRTQHLFDHHYSSFMLSVLKKNITNTMKQKEFEKMELDESMKIVNTSLSTSSDYISKHSLLSTCITHYLNVVLRSNDSSLWMDWKKVIVQKMKYDTVSCTWFLKQIAKGQWMSEYIMKCPITTAKEYFTELVVVALQIVEEKVEPNIVAVWNRREQYMLEKLTEKKENNE